MPRNTPLCPSPRQCTPASDFTQLSYGRVRNDTGSHIYRPAPHKGWRLSSSWGRWSFDPDKSSREERHKDKEQEEDVAAWGRTYEKLEKDTADLFELIKKRIDADPFDALFGRHFHYPNRARTTWWGMGESSGGPTTDAKAPGSGSKPGHAADLDGIKKKQNEGAPSSPSDSSYRHTGGYSGAGPSADNATEDFVIDPITMRKIPRKSSIRTTERDDPSKTSTRTIDIPIKRFDGYTTRGPSRQLSEKVQSERLNSTHSLCSDTSSIIPREVKQRDWLTREGFGSKTRDELLAEFPDPVTAARISPRIESALDRRMRAHSQDLDKGKSESGLRYEAQENKAEDVDLLRASDIRAASGRASRMRRQPELRKNLDRIKLDAELEALEKMEAIERGWEEELAASQKHLKAAEAKKRDKARNAHLETEVSAQKAAMEAIEMRQAGDRTTRPNIASPHAERGDGDVASNVHEFASRDRWYKRKAPHAARADEQEAVHSAKARSLIREIRGIYEETYGIIDTKHRQPKEVVPVVCGQNLDNPPTKQGRSIGAAPEEANKLTRSSGPLSVQEKIGTMLQQLLDDSRYMQKLLRTPGLTSQLREELFHRNRSMQNALDAIAEALSNPSVPRQGSKKQTVVSDHHSVMADQQQMSQPILASNDVKKPSSVYSVLAYDPWKQQVTAAEMITSSKSPSERRVPLSEALSSLTHPAKFLPQLTKLQSQGDEIVSSDTNILVLKKNCKTLPSNFSPPPPLLPSVADNKASGESKECRRSVSTTNSTTALPENSASPTSFANHNSGSPVVVESEGAGQIPSVHKVRRKEDVFSGPSRKTWHDNRFGGKTKPKSRGSPVVIESEGAGQGPSVHKVRRKGEDISRKMWHDNRVWDKTKPKSRFQRSSRRWRTTKRVLWVASWTAGCCYAVGVLTEYLRA
ncbi:MAG: hypothetical protein Q9223_002312 [Gallowayella weberi]